MDAPRGIATVYFPLVVGEYETNGEPPLQGQIVFSDSGGETHAYGTSDLGSYRGEVFSYDAETQRLSAEMTMEFATSETDPSIVAHVTFVIDSQFPQPLN